jgi:hypothetical protein
LAPSRFMNNWPCAPALWRGHKHRTPSRHIAVSALPVLLHRIVYTAQSVLRRFLALYSSQSFIIAGC